MAVTVHANTHLSKYDLLEMTVSLDLVFVFALCYVIYCECFIFIQFRNKKRMRQKKHKNHNTAQHNRFEPIDDIYVNKM